MAAGDKDIGNLALRKKQYNIQDTGSNNKQYINLALKRAWKGLYHTQKKADIMRKTYLEELANYKAETQGTSEGLEM